MIHSLDSSAAGTASPPPVDVNALCRRHWPSLHSLAVRRGCDPQLAEDAVQDLFCGLIRRGQLHQLGRLEPAHQTARLTVQLRHQIAKRWRDGHRQKRGGAFVFVSLWNDDGTPLDIADERTLPGSSNARHRQAALRRALAALRAEMKPSSWNAIAPWLLSRPKETMSGSQRVALYRARLRLRELASAASRD